MGHGKQSPRDKMIGMMYLVLTALLALNVSAEVLNAFVLVDKSLQSTTENFSKKNNVIYANFDAAMQDEATAGKAKPWKKIADKVKIDSDALIKHIFDLKDLILTTAEGEGNPYVSSEDRDPMLVQSKDDNNIPGQVMILEGKGEELRKKLEIFRDGLVSIIDKNTLAKNKKNFEGTLTGIKAALNTDDMPGQEGPVPWEVGNFDHLPLSGVLTMLSKMQADVRNSEADVLGFLWSKIDAGSWKFNKLEAIVVPTSNYVLVNGKYEAKVFIAASDSTQTPDITVSGNPLKIVDGKGHYVGGTGAVGFKTWGGVIKLESPTTGQMLEFPFKSEYQVGAASVTVSPTKMNVLYIGVPNPVSIAASGVSGDKLRVSMTNGKIVKSGDGYIVNVKKTGKAVINVSAEIGGATRQMGKANFRVKRVPDPVAKIGGKKGGKLRKAELLGYARIKAEMENFDFQLKYKIVSYTVSTTVGGFEQEAPGRTAGFNRNQIKLIKTVKPGKKIYFENIKAKGPDGSIRSLGTISFKL